MGYGYSYKEPVIGSVDISVKFDSKPEYLKWKYYVDPGRKWDFDVTYPAIMRTTWEFRNALDVETLNKKIVWLLELGFNVHSANWRLKKAQQEQPLK